MLLHCQQVLGTGQRGLASQPKDSNTSTQLKCGSHHAKSKLLGASPQTMHRLFQSNKSITRQHVRPCCLGKNKVYTPVAAPAPLSADPAPVEGLQPPPICAGANQEAIAASVPAPSTASRTAGVATPGSESKAPAKRPRSFAERLAELLGYAVLLGSCVRSVPQLMRMVSARSAEGVSLVGTLVQVVCYAINVAYNAKMGYPLHTYGEVVTCWAQEVAQLVLICWFSRPPLPVQLAAAAAVLLPPLVLVVPGLCSDKALSQLQKLTVAATALGGRLPQVLLVQRRRDAGVLSGATSLLNFLGNLARLFSAAVLTRDGINVAAAAMHSVLNGVLLVQVLVFSRGRPIF